LKSYTLDSLLLYLAAVDASLEIITDDKCEHRNLILKSAELSTDLSSNDEQIQIPHKSKKVICADCGEHLNIHSIKNDG
jgi:RNase P subunit RPR2